ncbi:MAG: helix-turn-helix transcriptional regulator [Sphingomonas bacterium]
MHLDRFRNILFAMAETDDFTAKLSIVLKALTMSRGRLAVEVGVDKSLVGRWCAGTVRPSAHNLARLTEAIAARSAGFTMHDWDKSPAELAERFGVSLSERAARSSNEIDWISPQIFAEAMANTGARASDYEGFWRTTRLASELPGHFIHDHVMLRRTPAGVLGYRAGVFDVRFTGWALPLQNQLVTLAHVDGSGTFVFGIFNGTARHRADVMDGLLLTCLRDAGTSPVAMRCLMTRVGQLSGDVAADDEKLVELLASPPVATPESAPDAVRQHLWSECGMESFAQGGDATLAMHFARSMARGPIFSAPLVG